MVFIGKIEQIFPIMEMTINNEPSKKQEFLLEIETGKFPRSIVVEVWNDKVNNPNIAVGNQVSIEAHLKARKVKDRFFNNITAQKIDLVK
jgi:DNA replicative helicase MCM subunit Mcm2 (Cdc46/Mcm family)